MSSEQVVRSNKVWDRSDVITMIREIVGDLAPSPGELAEESRLIEDLGFHSLSLLELAFSLEDEFDLPTIDETTARQILTLRDVEQHVHRALENAQRLRSE